MLAKCANPSCFTPFRYLETGTLFRRESDPLSATDTRSREYFWLCRRCSADLTLQLDETANIRIVQRRNTAVDGEESVDFVPLDRKQGMLLSRISLFGHRGRRREKPLGGQIRL